MAGGILNSIIIKPETVWGTPVIPDHSISVRMEGGIQTDQDIQLLSALRNHHAKNYHAQMGNRVHEGDYVMELFPDTIGYFFQSAFGSLGSSLVGGETIVYIHDIQEDEPKPSLTIQQQIGENIRRYAGVMIHTIKISGKAGEPLEFSASVKAKSQASDSLINAPPGPDKPFDFADTSITIGGTSFTEIESFEFEYKNNVELLHTLSNHDPAYKYSAGSEISGKLDMYLDTATLAKYQDYLDKTDRSIVLTFTGAAIGVASNYKLEITLHRAVFTSGVTELTEDYNLLSVEFQGLFDDDEGEFVHLELTNLVNSYVL